MFTLPKAALIKECNNDKRPTLDQVLDELDNISRESSVEFIINRINTSAGLEHNTNSAVSKKVSIEIATEEIYEEFSNQRKILEGGSGIVYETKWKSQGMMVALKRLLEIVLNPQEEINKILAGSYQNIRGCAVFVGAISFLSLRNHTLICDISSRIYQNIQGRGQVISVIFTRMLENFEPVTYFPIYFPELTLFPTYPPEAIKIFEGAVK
ncbi:20436_t:CDS:2 [Dentiscutata erythropus]|uniref:20436_t:CDS:1 n=1 Tax=Dentiscutata erythropus TaxID=1348616 RepID=A0A9N8Z718_9GLOM|nr:20436_t:CDS:2 [Dentiscutata erythropus]